MRQSGIDTLPSYCQHGPRCRLVRKFFRKFQVCLLCITAELAFTEFNKCATATDSNCSAELIKLHPRTASDCNRDQVYTCSDHYTDFGYHPDTCAKPRQTSEDMKRNFASIELCLMRVRPPTTIPESESHTELRSN